MTERAKAIDPTCRCEVDTKTAPKTEYNGKTYYFCCPICKDVFEKEPEKYVKEESCCE